jgi:putative nucleotidyltransferase with HDIG domain
MSLKPNTNKWPHSVYVGVVIAVGLAIIAYSLAVTVQSPPEFEWFTLAMLTLLTGSFTVKVPSLSARFSVSETFVFASALMFGPSAGTLTVVLDALVISFWLNKSTRSLRRILFNVAAPSVAFWTAATVFFGLAHVVPGSIHQHELRELVLPLFVFALLYFLTNTWLVAQAVAGEKDLSAASIWVGHFSGFGINYFVGSSVAILLVSYAARIDLTVLSIIVPLLLISYATFRTSMGRLEDANRHVSQLNEMYLSTIEALAMAVDAKDQITHGHIRRVQSYAVQLAKRVGVADEKQLKAIEAAALLHDMGKLAIPEHILNKPGKLTPAEFEKMKRHADLGADLLSSVRFPYPVVPIVRHHHENWDGTGYPGAISGTDIPIGARILSVVDCFDALTSDRPYRPRLSVDDAFEILKERRGTIYDPLIVDTFVKAYQEIVPAAADVEQNATPSFAVIDAEAVDSEHFASLRHIRANAAENALLIAHREKVLRAASISDAIQAASQCLRQVTPALICALYEYDTSTDSLVCKHAVGDSNHLLPGLSIPMGERVTGWSAATRRPSINADASLDLANLSEFFEPPLRSVLCTPLVHNNHLVGVLTAYSNKSGAFSDIHGYAFEQMASSLIDRLQADSVADTSRRRLVFRPRNR